MSIETYTGNGHGSGVARYQAAPGTLAPSQPRTVVRLTEWAESARAAHEVASSLVQTSFVPEAFRDKAHEATAAILAGDEVGLSPMASLRAFDLIQGTAAPRAITHRAVVQSVGHEVWLVEATDRRAIVRGRRAGETEIQESEWTIERARSLGLTSKQNWRNQPKAMLIARATSECCRLVASDALMGMPYSVEELTDGEPDGSAGPAEPKSPRRTAQRRSQPGAAPPQGQQQPEPTPPEEPDGPPLPGEDGYERPAAPPVEQPEPDREPDRITRDQSKHLHAIFTEAGISNRDTKVAAASKIVGREVGSSNDLSKTEATTLIDTLRRMSEGGGLAVVVAELVDRPDAETAEDGQS